MENQKAYYLFFVDHPVGSFIGVATSMEEARKHFGTVAHITPMDVEDVLDLRAKQADRVILAI